VSEVAKQLKF